MRRQPAHLNGNIFTYQWQFDVSRIGIEIMSFIQHPIRDGTILVTTPHQIVEMNSVSCLVLAGTPLADCAYNTNNYSFTAISHLLHVNFEAAGRRNETEFFSAYSILAADILNHCIRMVDLKRPLHTVTQSIGKCGTGMRMEHNIPLQVEESTINGPRFLAASYSANRITLYISCTKPFNTKNQYLVAVHFYPATVVVYEYKTSFSSGYVTGISKFGSVLRSFRKGTVCMLARWVSEVEVVYEYECSNEHNSFIPVPFFNHLLVIHDGSIELINPNEHLTSKSFTALQVNNLPEGSMPTVDQFAISSSNERLFAYSKRDETIYALKLNDPSVKHNCWSNRFAIAAKNSSCGGAVLAKYAGISEESCAYICIKTPFCSAFTLARKLGVCYAHAHQMTIASQAVGSICYFRLLDI